MYNRKVSFTEQDFKLFSKSLMAFPMLIPSDKFTYTNEEIYISIAILAFIITMSSLLCTIEDIEPEKQKQKITPSKKRSKKQKCPNAPKAKRQCAEKSPMISSIKPRELFPVEKTTHNKNDNYNITTPNAPTKLNNQNTTFTMAIDDDTKRKLFVFNAGEKQTEQRECPNAPIKLNKTERKTNEIDVMVATKLLFDELMEPSIENLLSIPKKHEEISKETEFICSLYKPSTIIDELINEINQNADKVDFNNPDRIIWNFNPAGISNYILTINKIYQSIKIINEKKIALTQNVNVFTNTNRNHNDNDNDEYRLIDKLINIVLTIQQLNLTLSDRLLMVYNNWSHKWLSIPNSYLQACKLSHDASILQKKIFNEVWYNMNLTPWSEW
jgi:hypothetical protein